MISEISVTWRPQIQDRLHVLLVLPLKYRFRLTSSISQMELDICSLPYELIGFYATFFNYQLNVAND